MSLKVGNKLPDFQLNDDKGLIITPKNLTAKYTVIYFYPKDDTPGCTTEAIDFDNYGGEFEKLNTDVIGVSKDSVESHQAFKTKYRLNIMLLSDPNLDLHKKFGAYGEKTSFGKTSLGVIRSTFIVNQKHEIIKVYPKVKAAGHAKEVLTYIKSLG